MPRFTDFSWPCPCPRHVSRIFSWPRPCPRHVFPKTSCPCHVHDRGVDMDTGVHLVRDHVHLTLIGNTHPSLLTHPRRNHSHSNYQQFFLHKFLHEQVLKLLKKISFSEIFFSKMNWNSRHQFKFGICSCLIRLMIQWVRGQGRNQSVGL